MTKIQGLGFFGTRCSKTTDTILAGLVLAETVGYEGLILLSPVINTRKF